MITDARKRIEQLADKMPAGMSTSKQPEGMKDILIAIVEGIVREQIANMAQQVTVNPNITVPEIKMPEIRIPEFKMGKMDFSAVKIPPAINNITMPKMDPVEVKVEFDKDNYAKKWEFTINRDARGLIDSVTAERMD